MKLNWKVLVLPALLVAAGCEVPEDAKQAIEQAKAVAKAVADSDIAPDQLKSYAQLAVDLEKDPSQAEALLQKHGVSAEEFEKAMYKIAESPELSKVFEQLKQSMKK
ncbi:MAG: hypothetical protein R3B81_15910 [bacterium]